ncbi:hypothetical protein BDBG_04793 [Blastomyces gilchristii SLH14081]|uniref:Uncharacterized protein n=1 Tax=Blastomyces gilchristii (strain SLH14081) TaxID=559298 RepID=A0A179UMT9_BLAGS|nr:uncharacterized protein BDBG_04793 [Blastomyces gilchristii SLH14081]OAT08529.1 hypothetical protein BDBG_04793 [Blastomyces gilchristii SLH14081]
MSSGNPPDPTGGNPSPSLPDSPSNEPTQPPSEPTQPPPPTTPSPPSPTVPPPNPRPPPPEPSQPQPPRPTTSRLDPVAAGRLGHNANSHDIVHRGPSNASSAYSNANRSDISDDIPVPGVAPGTAQYYDDPYYTDGAGQPGGPFVDNPYGAPPVIRDVQARRNTRIENPSVFPQQGNAGIAQNF